VLFIGTADLSFSLGLRGRQDEPLLDERSRTWLPSPSGTASFWGVRRSNPEQVKRYHAQGFQVPNLNELGLIAAGAKSILGRSHQTAAQEEACALLFHLLRVERRTPQKLAVPLGDGNHVRDRFVQQRLILLPRSPRENDRSAVPINSTSIPGVAAISSDPLDRAGLPQLRR